MSDENSATTPEARRLAKGKPLAGTKLRDIARKFKIMLKRKLPQKLGLREKLDLYLEAMSKTATRSRGKAHGKGLIRTVHPDTGEVTYIQDRGANSGKTVHAPSGKGLKPGGGTVLSQDHTEYEGPSLIEQLEFIRNFLTEISVEKASDVASSVLAKISLDQGMASAYDKKAEQARRIAAKFEKRKKGQGKEFTQKTGEKEMRKTGDAPIGAAVGPGQAEYPDT
jgi:hypothetical protein